MTIALYDKIYKKLALVTGQPLISDFEYKQNSKLHPKKDDLILNTVLSKPISISNPICY
jgi:hypothetical protein